MSLERKMAVQLELLGISMEAHPLELLADQISRSGAITTVDAVERIRQQVIVVGIRQTSRRSRTAKGETMLFLTLEDIDGILDVILFPEVYRQARSIINSKAPFLVTGMIELDADHGEPVLRAEKVAKLK